MIDIVIRKGLDFNGTVDDIKSVHISTASCDIGVLKFDTHERKLNEK